ncbi:hypothetical protein LSAT2_013862 [Lamellibrachia satsuma]|nr:hypothetical protein LSAT2_013862 [Lamellibrachia satsuma]
MSTLNIVWSEVSSERPFQFEAVVISAAQKRKRVQPPVGLVIDVCGCSVTPKPFIRDIGFVFDDTMSPAAQIRRVCHVAYCHIRGIATIRKCLSTIACKTIIHALVMPLLDFGNAMLYGLPTTQLRQLQMIQNSAARLITGTHRRDHITPVLFSLHWLPVSQRIEFKLLLFVFRAVHRSSLPSVSVIASDFIHTHPNTETADQHLLTIPRYHLERYGRRAFSVAGPTLWDALPPAVRQANSVAAAQAAQTRTVMRDLTRPLVAAAWLVSLATSAIAEPFCKTPNEREANQETILPILWDSGQFEVEVTVPQQLQTAHIASFTSETVVSHREAQANANEFVTFNGSDVLHKHVYSFYSDEDNIYNITGKTCTIVVNMKALFASSVRFIPLVPIRRTLRTLGRTFSSQIEYVDNNSTFPTGVVCKRATYVNTHPPAEFESFSATVVMIYPSHSFSTITKEFYDNSIKLKSSLIFALPGTSIERRFGHGYLRIIRDDNTGLRYIIDPQRENCIIDWTEMIWTTYLFNGPWDPTNINHRESPGLFDLNNFEFNFQETAVERGQEIDIFKAFKQDWPDYGINTTAELYYTTERWVTGGAQPNDDAAPETNKYNKYVDRSKLFGFWFDTTSALRVSNNITEL